ncbi:hypothetical protein B0H14DRAFT_2695735 [Mycena olivaceomarginata]|nr:hypothetical protein B0H14DRAFT_2695735 [Mycena olivaceomarginata]
MRLGCAVAVQFVSVIRAFCRRPRTDGTIWAYRLAVYGTYYDCFHCPPYFATTFRPISGPSSPRNPIALRKRYAVQTRIRLFLTLHHDILRSARYFRIYRNANRIVRPKRSRRHSTPSDSSNTFCPSTVAAETSVAAG